jgi:uncharacterized protein (UPF0332 family)
MTAIGIRQKLHHHVDNSDDKLLKLMYALAREYNEEEDLEYEFTEKDLEQFNQRRESWLRGESKMYSPEEARFIITGKGN